MKDGGVLIGDLAHRVHVNRETLRYYERRGLLKPSRRTAAGYRVYDSSAEQRLIFIKRAQVFGFSLEEISALLSLRPENPPSCRRVLTILESKVEKLGEQIAAMKRFHRQMSRYKKRCAQAIDQGARCPLIEEVTKD